MKSYINKTTVISAVATMAGLFIYKSYIAPTVQAKLNGGNA